MSSFVGSGGTKARPWRAACVGDGSLTQAVAEIRRALGDAGHRLVRNVARRGYMLVPDAPGDAPALSIAVLPLAVEGPAAECAWFADALLGDLIDELAPLQGAMVIGRGTMSSYSGRSPDPRQVARELRVRQVVLGRVRPEAEAMRLSMALVDGDSGVQRWSDSFVVARARLPQVLADLTMQIGRALLPGLHRSAVEQRAALTPREVSADDLALRGMVAWNRGLHADNVAAALALLERAVALDPDCARGWSGLSFINVHAVANGWAADREAAVRRVCEAAAQLERLDADAFHTHQAKVCRAFLTKDWPALLRLTAAWVERTHHPNAFGARGMALLLNGRADEAAAALEEALRLDSHSGTWAEWQHRLAMAHFVAGRYELACDWALTAALANPGLPWPPVHAAALQRLERRKEAQQAFAEFIARHPGFEVRHVVERLPGEHPSFIDGRERLLASLRDLGLP